MRLKQLLVLDLNIINGDWLRNVYQDIVQSEEVAPGSHLDLGDGSVLTPVSHHRSSKIRTYVRSRQTGNGNLRWSREVNNTKKHLEEANVFSHFPSTCNEDSNKELLDTDKLQMIQHLLNQAEETNQSENDFIVLQWTHEKRVCQCTCTNTRKIRHYELCSLTFRLL